MGARLPASSDTDGTTATERVARAIYRAVMEHRLVPGERLREAALAAEFGVSRTVVRQALLRLADAGAVEMLHNRGARVPLPNLEDARHVFDARRMVECEIVRRLGGRLDADQLAELEGIADAESRADREGDTAEAVRRSGEFHQALARMHGNPVYEKLLAGLLPTTSLLMARFKQGGGQACKAHRHVDLIEALRQGGSPAATEMRRHLAELERSLSGGAAPQRPLRDAFAAYKEPPK